MTANANERMLWKYVLALLPAVLTLGGWQAAVWAFDYFGCTGNIKDLQPCFAGGLDVNVAIGIGLFWCQILSWICVPVSIGTFLGVMSRQIAAHLGWQDLVLWPSFKKQDEPRCVRYRRRTPH